MEAATVIGAAVLHFIFSYIWRVSTRARWVKAWEITDTKLKKIEKDTKPHIIAFITSLWASYGMFLIIKHIHPNGLTEIVSLGISCWFFILVGFNLKHYLFARVKPAAFIVDTTQDLIGCVIMALMIA